RSIESCAPRSGFHGAVCAQALAQSSSAGPVSAPAAAAAVPAFTRARREYKAMAVPLPPLPFPPNCCKRSRRSFLSVGYPVSRRFVEQMHESRIGLEPDPIARPELMAFAKYGNDVLAAQSRHHLKLGAGWLDHLDDRFGPV